MSKLTTVGKLFQRKLALAAANQNLDNLKDIYQAANAFAQTKQLWMNACENPYSTRPEIGSAVDKIVNTAQRAYSQAITQGMPAKGQFGYAGFLTNMNNAIEALHEHDPFPKLDPMAANKLDTVKQSVEKARAEFVPIGIPGRDKGMVMQDNLTITPESGALYPPEDEYRHGTTPPYNPGIAAPKPVPTMDQLTNVVQRMEPSPLPWEQD